MELRDGGIMKGWTDLKKFAQNGAFQGDGLLVGCDFDGTIVPFTRRPSQVKIPQKMRRVLSRLIKKPGVRVVIISGRSLADVKKKLGLKGAIYCGNHGLEMERGLSVWIHPEARAISRRLKILSAEIQSGISDLKGAELEDKTLSLSLHYRRVSRASDIARLKRLLNCWMSPHRRYLRVVSGKKLFDIRPKLDWNKGHALLNLIESLPGSWSACFVGDDKTDEEAFETLGGRALTVRVGPALKSKARFLLKNRGYVHSFLELIAGKKYEKINQP